MQHQIRFERMGAGTALLLPGPQETALLGGHLILRLCHLKAIFARVVLPYHLALHFQPTHLSQYG